ncbi:MAG: CHAT domain-containing protein [Caldilineaceae bacterium]
MTASTPSQLPVVFLAFAGVAIGDHTPLVRLAGEAAQLGKLFRNAKRAGKCELELIENATLEKVLDTFQDPDLHGRIAVFHFAGHADSYELLMEEKAGKELLVDAGGFARFLAEQPGLSLVFLNACSTGDQVDELHAANVPAVVATTEEIPDDWAALFAVRFYTGMLGGATIASALRAAEAEAQSRYGQQDDWPWNLYTPPGAPENADWKLGDAANDPLFGLPALPKMDLPETPYRHLEWFRREDAWIFFGRGREIADLYRRIIDVEGDPIILFYGQSGVGKSSVLAAGLFPRLERVQTVAYCRRDAAKGLVGSLAAALDMEEGAEFLAKWRSEEERLGKPFTIILDQVEEIYTRPCPDLPGEEKDFLDALASIFADPSKRPHGKLVLSFRKEWLAEIEARLKELTLPRAKVFLQRLERRGIVEAIAGPSRTPRLRNRYGLSVADALPDAIAGDLLGDLGSPVAPMLQILLTGMWEAARAQDPDNPRFDEALYGEMRARGLGLGDFLARQLATLSDRLPDAAASGLAIDVLAAHTTPLGTAEQRTAADLARLYRHCTEVLPGLVQACRDLALLVDPAQNQPDQPPASRLTHDTLALHVRRRFDESDAPGQRARRILENRAVDWTDGRDGTPLDDTDLSLVEAGRSGMRAWKPHEERLVEASRRSQTERRAEQERMQQERAEAERQAQAEREKSIAAGVRAVQARAANLVYHSQAAPPAAPQVSLLLAVEAHLLMTSAGLDLPYVEQALHDALNRPLGLPILTQRTGVKVAAYDPASRVLAAGDVDGVVRFWAVNGREYQPMAGNLYSSGSITTLAFDPSGRWLAIGDANRGLMLLDRKRDNRPVTTARAHKGSIRLVAFSPDGRWLASASGASGIEAGAAPNIAAGTASSPESGSGGYDLLLWDLRTPEAAQSALAPPIALLYKEVLALSFTADSDALAAAEKDKVTIWDMSGGSPLDTPTRNTRLSHAAFALECSMVAGFSAKGVLQVRSMDNPRRIVANLGEQEDGKLLELSPDGHWLASLTSKDILKVFNLTSRDAAIVSVEAKRVLRTRFSADGKWLALATADNAVLVRRMDQPNADFAVLYGHEGQIEEMSFSPDGMRLATASADGSLRGWRLPPASADPFVLRPGDKGAKLALVDAGWRWVVMGCIDNNYWLWNLAALGDSPLPLSGYEGIIQRAAICDTGFWLAASASPDGTRNTIYLWDLRNAQQPPLVLAEHKQRVNSLAFSSDGQRLAAGDAQGHVLLWDLTSQSPRAEHSPADVDLDGSTKGSKKGAKKIGTPVNLIAFSPDAKWLAAGIGEEAVLWGLHAPKQQPIRQQHTGWVSALAFSADGRWLASGSTGRMLRLWNLEQPEGEQQILRGHSGAINGLSFSRRGDLLVSASGDMTARVWRLSQLTATPAVKVVQEQPGSVIAFGTHGAQVDLAALDSSARCLATTAADGIVRLWDPAVPDKQPVLLRGHTAPVLAAAFSPDERQLVTASVDGTVRLWEVQRDRLVGLACRMAGRNLSLVEWDQFVAGEERSDYHKSCHEWPAHPTVLDPLLERARKLAEADQIDASTAEFRKASLLEPALGIKPATAAAAAVAKSKARLLMRQARELALAQDVEGARKKLEEALQLDAELRIDPQQQAERYSKLKKGAGVKSKLWKPGRTLRVRFLDGDPVLWRRIEAAAQEWTRYANIYFQFGDDPSAEIRIAFDASTGNWSYVGSDALLIASPMPTMNLGGLNMTISDQALRGAVLSVFGHALGLINEQNNPNADIPWNKHAVYSLYMGPPNYWSRAQVDDNVFMKYDPKSLAVYKEFDPQSIMMSPVSDDLTIGHYEIGMSYDLSEMDKESIALLYPFDAEKEA